MLFPHHPVILSISLVTLKWCNIDIRPQEYITVGSWALNWHGSACGRNLMEPTRLPQDQWCLENIFLPRGITDDFFMFKIFLLVYMDVDVCAFLFIISYLPATAACPQSSRFSISHFLKAAKTLSRVRTLKLQSLPALTPSVHPIPPLLPPSFIHNINSERTRCASLLLTRFAAVSCDKNPTLIPDSESRIYNSILI